MISEVSTGQGSSTPATPAASPAQTSPAASPAATPASTGPTSAASHGGSPPISDPTAPIAYKPNLKFKFRVGDAQKESEFDPFMADVIKDEATEKMVRDLYERAHGINSVKDERKRYQDAYNELAPQHQELSTRVERLQGYIDNENIAAFQRETGIRDEVILKRAQQILAKMENPALKQQEDSDFARDQGMVEAQTQNQMLMQQVVQARTFELNTVMSRPDVQEAVLAFDTKMGPGAFRREIINRGSMYANAYQVDKSADELVREIMGFMGPQGQGTPPVIPAQPVVNAQGDGNSQEQGTRIVPPKKPVVPNLTGKGTSPVKKTIKSLDDLRQVSKEFAAANG
jgi:hypothetical protein